MLGFAIEALNAANRWIFRGRANSDVENDTGELLNDTAARGRVIFRRTGWRRKKKSQTHSFKSKICKLIILVIIVIVITSVIVCSVVQFIFKFI